ncbi:biotin--[acetyl-CoA-carboxylase] ligase [Paenibacillus sp. MMS18-CY102]|uniref:biotin--[acetyl-CoA-carboxylase] ligase n=1 Tax=Paenibacillus sp. MMS18-CY102 TaxID=2682849 RepID=UPI0013661A24|nr:biotin--[acetyl-CoA-carboxylase] ligase [Paenibacillus sp. MMS18-CY102]MWC28501.1 biotin--[acetyl-CoA-carboxylase] ligase [Paenibacillus sp. MMS18-CY102]
MDHTLLELLEQEQGNYLSGETISKAMNVSRTAVWKQIRKLEERGYVIEASRKLGYRLVSKPDNLSLDKLSELLQTNRFGRALRLLDVVDSTQNEAQRWAEDGAPEGAIVIAEQQLGGRGRMGRSWVSPYTKGIWMSLIMRPSTPIHFAPQLTLLTAVALCRSLRKTTGLEIGIKWPNDLLINGKKISGILLESAAEDERIKYVVAGTGISVNLDISDYPEELLERATSLSIQAGRKFSREQVIADFLLEWEQLYDLYLKDGFGAIQTLWEALAVTLHQDVTIHTPQGQLSGKAMGLHESGALELQLPSGELRLVFSGEMGQPSPPTQ